MSIKPQKGDKVKVHYIEKLPDGTEVDNSYNSSPLEFTLGREEMHPGFEQAIMQLQKKEKKLFEIAAEKAYGPYMEEFVFTISREEIGEEAVIARGNELKMEDESGHCYIGKITEYDENTVTLDINSPYAGLNMTYEIELLDFYDNRTKGKKETSPKYRKKGPA